MQYLFGDWAKVDKRVLQTKHILLCADFDGTITPIKPRPQQAILGKKTRLLLARLSKNKAFTVAIVTGRSLADIKKKVPVQGLIFAGNHGLEILYKNKKFVYPQAKKIIPLISKLGRALRTKIRSFSGAVLEEKELSLSLHYRLVNLKKLRILRKIFLQLINPYLAQGEIRFTLGKKVWEVRPPIDWDKGRAVLYLVKKLRQKGDSIIYLGDDTTDEDAFRAVNKIGGLSIVVGKRPNSCAKYYLKNTHDAQKFLTQLQLIKS